ncbi:tetratricopeptide repeat protein [bacterium]|nr:tetratricopeptide repeat protein [bacterium]
MLKRFVPTAALLLLGLLAAGCQGELDQSDLDALAALPAAERAARIEQLIAAHPEQPQLPGLLAKARYEDYAGLAPQARIEAIKAALRDDPENAITSKLLGDAYADCARGEGGVSYLDSALFAYENAALKAPHFFSAVGSVGALYDEKEDFEQAIAWYEKALLLVPDHVPTLCNLGASHYNRGDYAQAMDYYRRALALDPRSQDAHFNLGVAFAEATIYREAIREWREVVAIDSTTAVAKEAAKNADLLQDVLDETIYKGGKKSRRINLQGTE